MSYFTARSGVSQRKEHSFTTSYISKKQGFFGTQIFLNLKRKRLTSLEQNYEIISLYNWLSLVQAQRRAAPYGVAWLPCNKGYCGHSLPTKYRQASKKGWRRLSCVCLSEAVQAIPQALLCPIYWSLPKYTYSVEKLLGSSRSCDCFFLVLFILIL